MIRSLLLILLLTVSGAPSMAQELRHPPPTPDDFAWQWPLAVDAEQDMMRFTLAPEVYSRLWRDDLSDLVVFNAAGEAVPLAPLEGVLDHAGRLAAPPPPLEAPLFHIPRVGARNTGERLRLIVAERNDGRLERIDTGVELGAAGPDLLLDLSAMQTPVRALLVEFEAGSPPLNARVDVFGSRDLSNWTRLVAQQALVSLNEGGLKLERSRIEFAPTHLPYLRLLRTDRQTELPIAKVLAVRGRAIDTPDVPHHQIALEGEPEARGHGHVYHSDGPFPVEQVAVTLADRNAAASVIIESRPRADLPWRERARGNAFRVGTGAGSIDSAAFDTGLIRDRQWRVRTEPVQARAPQLTLLYRPDQFALLTQGEPPFRLAAGSARAQRSHVPLHAVLAQLRSSRGDDGWMPPEAELGRGAELAGSAALAPRPDADGSPTAWQWLLWGLLLAGAFTVVAMVLKLLRQSGA